MEQLEGRVAVVTGAASGIGKAVATALAREGMRVVLSDIEQGTLDAPQLGLARGELLGRALLLHDRLCALLRELVDLLLGLAGLAPEGLHFALERLHRGGALVDGSAQRGFHDGDFQHTAPVDRCLRWLCCRREPGCATLALV